MAEPGGPDRVDARDAEVEALLARARADYAAGRDAAAEAGARAVLARAPLHAGARHLLAACRLAAGALEEGAAGLAAVLAATPGAAEVRLQLAEVLARLGRHPEIVALLEEAVRAQPGLVAALRPLAAAQWETGARGAAIATWRRLVGLQPDNGAALAALGHALRQTGDGDGARAALRRAVALQEAAAPRAAAAAQALAEARISLAELLMDDAVAHPPGDAAVAEAVAQAQRARAEAPGAAALLVRCGAVLHRASAHAAAEASYDAALALDPGQQDARLFRAMLRLLRGDLAGGWLDYEARRRPRMQAGPWRVPDRLDGLTVRVVPEQGAGDTIQFARYLPLLAARGARVEVVAAPDWPLAPLLAGMPAVSAFVGSATAAPGAEVVVPLLSLPLAFGTGWDSVPAQVPYLAAPAERVAHWRARLAEADDRRPRVGVAWWGNAAFSNDRQRSIPPDAIAGLLRRRDVAFHVLAPGLREGDAGAVEGLATVHGGLRDYADTAALATLMDLVISVDTSVAHLAGALGRDVWLLLPYEPDWRWLLGRHDSPWYPTARLFRQSVRGDWAGVVSRVREALDAKFG